MKDKDNRRQAAPAEAHHTKQPCTHSWAAGRRARTLVTGLLVAVVAALVAALPASARIYEIGKLPYDMRSFVATAASNEWGCSPGNLQQGQIRITAPSNYGVWVYVTTTPYSWSGSSWVSQNTVSQYPGGFGLAAGQSVTVPAWSIPNARSMGYWYVTAEVDFHALGTYAELGSVEIKPNVVTDWYSAYRYAGNGYSYCWHS
jgi:hypothetical protein